MNANLRVSLNSFATSLSPYYHESNICVCVCVSIKGNLSYSCILWIKYIHQNKLTTRLVAEESDSVVETIVEKSKYLGMNEICWLFQNARETVRVFLPLKTLFVVGILTETFRSFTYVWPCLKLFVASMRKTPL